MSGSGVSPSNTLKERAAIVRAQFAASGTSVSDWSREKGFSESLVRNVLSGTRPCRIGKSHKVAVALGIKDEAPPPGIPLADAGTEAQRLGGIRG